MTHRTPPRPDTDQERARELVNVWDLAEKEGYARLADRIAAALAAERERVLAPFRGLPAVGTLQGQPVIALADLRRAIEETDRG